MEHSANVSTRQFAQAYIMLMCYGISNTELKVLTEILVQYINISRNAREPYVSKLLFSSEIWSELKKSLNLTSQGMMNYKKSFIDKGWIIKNPDLTIASWLIPQETVTFKFNVDYES